MAKYYKSTSLIYKIESDKKVYFYDFGYVIARGWNRSIFSTVDIIRKYPEISEEQVMKEIFLHNI